MGPGLPLRSLIGSRGGASPGTTVLPIREKCSTKKEVAMPLEHGPKKSSAEEAHQAFINIGENGGRHCGTKGRELRRDSQIP